MVKAFITSLKPQSVFGKRIKLRHAEFWGDPDAENIRNTIMEASDTIDKWTDVHNWQRRLSNKYNSREFAKMHGCKVADLYWRGKDVETINLQKLPENYVIRPTIGHSCNGVFVMKKDVNLFDKKSYTDAEIKDALTQYLSQNPKTEFLIEEFLTSEDGEYRVLTDYKFFAFNGHIAAILVINRLSPKAGFQTAYTQNWEQTTTLVTTYPEGNYQNPPECLNEMIADVKKLSKTYEIFVRVDFYATNRGSVFGEFSPTPIVGNCSTPFANKLFKQYWDKYCSAMI